MKENDLSINYNSLLCYFQIQMNRKFKTGAIPSMRCYVKP